MHNFKGPIRIGMINDKMRDKSDIDCVPYFIPTILRLLLVKLRSQIRDLSIMTLTLYRANKNEAALLFSRL